MAKKKGPEGGNGGPSMEDPVKSFPVKTIAVGLILTAAGVKIIANPDAIKQIESTMGDASDTGAPDLFKGVLELFKNALLP